jgi:tRNA (mo5U34)-methyltransferase
VAFTKDQLTAISQSVPLWWHSIDLGQGVVTPGVHPLPRLQERMEALRLPDLRGKSVLDIGAYDGFYSFEAERRGADRVLSLDHYVWSLDLPAHIEYWKACKEDGRVPEPYHLTPHWRPAELPGKRGYDAAHRALESRVETQVGDFMVVDPAAIGVFDVVFFLGVLYHLENPLEAMRRVAALTGELAIIETASVFLPGYEHESLCEFYASNELNGDVSNWWAPNARTLEGLCKAAGFSRVDVFLVTPEQSLLFRLKAIAKFALAEFPVSALKRFTLHPLRTRLIAHARK